MKRLALLLAAVSALGTGCYVNNPPPARGDVDLAWRFIRTAPDGRTFPYGCRSGGVDTVLVSFAGGSSQAVPCADNAGDGALFAGVPSGSQRVVVTGRRGGVDLYTSEFTINVVAGASTPADLDVYGIPDDLDVFAELTNPAGTVAYASCNAAAVTGFTYRVVDSAGTVMATGSAACSTGLPGVAFHGNQALDRDTYTIRMQAPASGPVVFDSAATPDCSGQPFNHTGIDTGARAWKPLMYDVTGDATLCR
jgi:hypothetical protein